MAFEAKYLTREQLDRYYRQAEAHLEPQLLEIHLRQVIAGGYDQLAAEDQERCLALRHAGERLRLDWEQSRLAIAGRQGDDDGADAEDRGG